MRDLYPRLFEPQVLANGLPNPRHLPLPMYLALARRAALRGARAATASRFAGGCELPRRGPSHRPVWRCGCVYRMGKPMRPDVAAAFDRMAAAAREEAGLFLSIDCAFRSDAEQARLFGANPTLSFPLYSAARKAQHC